MDVVTGHRFFGYREIALMRHQEEPPDACQLSLLLGNHGLVPDPGTRLLGKPAQELVGDSGRPPKQDPSLTVHHPGPPMLVSLVWDRSQVPISCSVDLLPCAKRELPPAARNTMTERTSLLHNMQSPSCHH